MAARKTASKPSTRTVAKESTASVQKPRVRVLAGSSRSQFMSSAARSIPYEAAGTGRRSPSNGNPGPNSALLGALDRLRRDARQLARNNAFAGHAIDQLTANTVGTGIKPLTPYPDLQRLWDDWTDEADSRGQTDFYGLQAMAFRAMVEGGDSFVRLRPRRKDDMETVPLQLQVLEADHVPASKSGKTANGNPILGGVERNLRDAVEAYWMYRVHPSDRSFGDLTDALREVRVPAADVCHLMVCRRPGEVRGEPWLARALVRLRDLDLYDDAELVRKKTAAMFGGFIEKPLDEDGAVPGEEAGDDEDHVLQGLEPGTFPVLPPGHNVKFSEPVDVGGSYEAFMRQQLSAIAVAVGMTYEQLTHDWRGANDRTYRAAMLEFGRMVDSWQWHCLVFQLCRPVWRRFVATAIASGAWTPPEGASERDIYRCEWTPPARGYIHPVQEVRAWADAIRLGITSRKRVAGQLGEDVAKIDMENAHDKARAEAAGIRYTAYVAEGEPLPETEPAKMISALELAELKEAVAKLQEAATDQGPNGDGDA